jgi:hypothetical protein
MNEQLPADLAAEISELESLWSYDAEQQGWLVYRPGPLGALTNTLTTLDQGDFLFLRVALAQTNHLFLQDRVSARGGQTAELVPGWSVIGYTGADGFDINALLGPQGGVSPRG